MVSIQNTISWNLWLKVGTKMDCVTYECYRMFHCRMYYNYKLYI